MRVNGLNSRVSYYLRNFVSSLLTSNNLNSALNVTATQASDGGAAAVPVGIIASNRITGGTFDHAIAILGLMQPQTGDVPGVYFGIEGRVDLGLTTGAGTGILGLATFNTVTVHPAAAITGVRARAEVGPAGAAGSGLAIALYATATGGGSNVHALFGDGNVVGDNGLILLKGYITAGAGSAQAVFSVDDTLDVYLIDVSDSKLLGMTVKLKDTAGTAAFKVIDSAGTAVLSVGSDGATTAGGKRVVNRVALDGGNDATANTRQMYRSGLLDGISKQVGQRMPWAGTVVGISVVTDSARLTGTAVFLIYKNGSTTGVTCTIDGTNTLSASGTGSVAFVAGDILDVRHTDTTYTPASSNAFYATMYVEFNS